jgi:DNA invertase Pin-like site-specific DNA recombinase/transposase-like protein
LRQLAKKRGVSVLYWVVDAGKSGLDFDKRKLDVVLELAERREIDEVLVVDVDRIGRVSRKLMGFLLDLRDYGVIIVTPQGEMDVDDLTGLMIAALKSWGAQYENERRRRASVAGRIQAFLKKRWNKPIPKGYRKRDDDWIEKDFTWKPILEDIFNLFIRYKNYKVVADAINTKHTDFLSKPLTRQQVATILRNPIYVGKPRYSGKMVEKQFENVVVDDPDLAFIDDATFERAQKIINIIRQKHQRKDNAKVKTLIDKYGVKVLDFLCHVFVMCPNCTCENCKAIMVRNGNPSQGEQNNYLCKSCGRQLRVPKKREIRKIKDWASKRVRSLKSKTNGSSKAIPNRKTRSLRTRKFEEQYKSLTLDKFL